MDADAETRAQLHTRIVVIRPNALLWPQEGEDLDPRLLHCFIPYLLRLAPLTERTGGGNLVPTDTGRYFRIRPEEVGLYKYSYASKWGYTTQEAIARGNQVIREVTTGRGVPEAGLNPMLAVAFAGLPHSRRLPNQLEHGLRNALKRAELRLRYHASGPVPMPRDRTVFSEPFEYAVYRLRGDDLFVVYAAYATQLEEGRRVALETVERMDRQRAQNIRTRRQELQHQFRRAMNQCRQKIVGNSSPPPLCYLVIKYLRMWSGCSLEGCTQIITRPWWLFVMGKRCSEQRWKPSCRLYFELLTLPKCYDRS
ncbi:uncharacterized protein PITG_03517 [Phytophthora infestans T30-4]|uniref:Uncharacterized protein n=1 Tax=Phytophthora infestans (strain T30-4) TaxID=403677 RepID=D0MXT7_PHYIT|nr:uncharacterized protein PITG_03517 [Phytophthora infestans T30-4]EEY65985.1 hypothetical protein PITG_03517 [Phytophthora infestans T30-4]|eukprot:XP_002906584.1 hypothetical protein PITG_03517 [Phytophthora infestans T30-4]